MKNPWNTINNISKKIISNILLTAFLIGSCSPALVNAETTYLTDSDNDIISDENNITNSTEEEISDSTINDTNTLEDISFTDDYGTIITDKSQILDENKKYTIVQKDSTKFDTRVVKFTMPKSPCTIVFTTTSFSYVPAFGTQKNTRIMFQKKKLTEFKDYEDEAIFYYDLLDVRKYELSADVYTPGETYYFMVYFPKNKDHKLNYCNIETYKKGTYRDIETLNLSADKLHIITDKEEHYFLSEPVIYKYVAPSNGTLYVNYDKKKVKDYELDINIYKSLKDAQNDNTKNRTFGDDIKKDKIYYIKIWPYKYNYKHITNNQFKIWFGEKSNCDITLYLCTHKKRIVINPIRYSVVSKHFNYSWHSFCAICGNTFTHGNDEQNYLIQSGYIPISGNRFCNFNKNGLVPIPVQSVKKAKTNNKYNYKFIWKITHKVIDVGTNAVEIQLSNDKNFKNVYKKTIDILIHTINKNTNTYRYKYINQYSINSNINYKYARIRSVTKYGIHKPNKRAYSKWTIIKIK